MTEQATLTLTEFKSTRETRRVVLLAEYRELVRALVKGIPAKSKQAGRLDDIMVRLKISDDDLANDIEDTKQHSRLSQSIAEFQAKQPQIDKQHAKWAKAISKARADLEAAGHRLAEAQHERYLAGQPHNRNRGDLKRKLELESRNPRVFGSLEG